MRFRLFTVLGVVLLAAGAVQAQSRRDRENPELVVEPGGRVGSCDSLQFTRDGKYLLAVGDDKVVRVWPYRDGQLHKDGMQVLRWSVWREQRGGIFALALSPDDENKYLAIAGLGAKTSEVAVLERSTGKMVHHALAQLTKEEVENGEPQPNALWSMTFAPDGKRVAFGDSFGGVWTWDFQAAPKRLGRHPGGGATNKVRFVHFFGSTLVSIAEDGTGFKWDFSSKPIRAELMTRFDIHGKSIVRVALSPDDNWFAAAVEGEPFVVLRSLDGKKSIPIKLDKNEAPRAVAFDPDSKRLAVSIGHWRTAADEFALEDEDRIVFYDLDGKRVEPDGPRGIYRAWFIAFHPNKKDLAIAGGDNNEVTLWNRAKMDRPVSVMDGVGKSLWDVAISRDGKQVAFRDQRNPEWNNPNDRAKGPWRAFHLLKRDWTDAAEFAKVQVAPKAAFDGWTVQAEKGEGNQWYADNVRLRKHLRIPNDIKREGLPFCWTFLPPGDNRPLRLAVGHLWGVSVYELTEAKKGEAKLVRLLTGHQGYVTSLAASEDGSYLVSASMDQTLSGWNMNDWPSQAALGASFERMGDRLFVKKVDVASPGWEAGLVAGDEVKAFYFDGKLVKDGPQAWLRQLENPQPGVEHGFILSRGGQEKRLLTTVRQRPLWRFFPTRDNEWVLWMWQNSYYDTSTKGDSYIGWVVNSADENREPAFYRAEQFRAIYERADVLDTLLDTHSTAAALKEALGDNPLPPRFDKEEPPFAAIQLAADTTKTDDVKATLRATPPGDNPDNQPEHTELWINDFRLEVDKNPQRWDRDGKSYRKLLTIPNAKLRAGDNVLTFQVYNKAGGRAEVAVKLRCTRPAAPPRLVGLAVGVNDYGAVKAGPGGRGKPDNLTSAVADATAIQKSWLAQTAFYQEADMFLELDSKATRADILNALDKLAKEVGPEDRCILFLAGHGAFVEHKGKSTTWLFLCPDFDVKRPEETSITSAVLYEKLAAIPCRKLVILDACHSGEAAANPVRSLVPGGQGPVIIASCDRNQFAYEDQVKLKHGLFTYALIRALGDDFTKAAKGKKVLDARDLYQYTREEMPELLKSIKVLESKQVPILFAPPGPTFAVAKAKE